ncbi:hypothetical protein F5X96DRAFT_322732 [Biscogniauxia mediterranea]|nr:hypothetical protein F5X96DRAFT_322732 [Biscogniauxia mediterranea]
MVYVTARHNTGTIFFFFLHFTWPRALRVDRRRKGVKGRKSHLYTSSSQSMEFRDRGEGVYFWGERWGEGRWTRDIYDMYIYKYVLNVLLLLLLLLPLYSLDIYFVSVLNPSPLFPPF